jgi:ketosteroid isomerase-like protein
MNPFGVAEDFDFVPLLPAGQDERNCNDASGAEMRAHSAMFIEFRVGKIVAQRNYDWFEPW